MKWIEKAARKKSKEMDKNLSLYVLSSHLAIKQQWNQIHQSSNRETRRKWNISSQTNAHIHSHSHGTQHRTAFCCIFIPLFGNKENNTQCRHHVHCISIQQQTKTKRQNKLQFQQPKRNETLRQLPFCYKNQLLYLNKH